MRPRVVISLGNFFFALFSTIITYMMIPYLSTFMSAAAAGMVIAAGALLSCFVFPLLPRLVARYGAQQLAIVFALAELLALFVLSAAPGAVAGAIFAAVAFSLQPFLAYELDILLEATVAEEGTTGRVRTLFITAWNVASLAAPLLIGALLAPNESYVGVFLAAAAAIVPFILLFAGPKLPAGRPPQLASLGETLRRIMRDRDLAAVTFGHLLLYLFFVWAPFYTPIYLHEALGIPWSELGWMFAVMLVPYVLIEYPAGVLADKLIGDKEMMFAGFLIAGSSLAAIGLFTSSTPIIVILAVLVASRAGAALIESMTEGHFFRRVSEKDLSSVSVFRGIWPLSDIIAPVVGSIILLVGSYQSLFFITGGFIAIAGMGTTLLIKDFHPGKKVVDDGANAVGTTY
ncbi:MAG: MFS transporter [Sulfuricaulis sp.]|nr:MFS transporter [Sulfuricaulis sp.]